MAQAYVTGPAHLFVGTPNGSPGLGGLGRAFYLGTAEQSPVIEIRPDWEPVFNDIRGTKKPYDVAFEGEEAFTFADLTRWNEPVYAALAARPNSVTALLGGPAVRGVNAAGDIGTLMLTEGKALIVWVVFPYALKAAYAAGGMPAGYRFPWSTFEGPDLLKPLGTKPRKLHVVFHHLAGYNPSTGAFGCYDHSIAGLPPIN